MNAITIPLAIYKQLVMSSAEWFADTRIKINHDQM
jgi:hypothetical protein